MDNLVTSSIKKSESNLDEIHELNPELIEHISGGCDGVLTTKTSGTTVSHSIDQVK